MFDWIMRLALQRVSEASVRVEGEVVGAIDEGLLVLVGVHREDVEGGQDWLIQKLAKLRVFPDEEGKMNRSLEDCGAAVLLVSQFTLFGNVARGTRPSFNQAAPPERARAVFEAFHRDLQVRLLKIVPTGVFGAEMQIRACLDGPVTLVLDDQDRDW